MSSSQMLLMGEGAGGAAPVYVEDVFSTWLYTGNDSTQTITNGIDLSTKGGLVWMKSRTDIASHALYDTVRGATQELESQATNAQTTRATGLTAFNSNGFSIGSRATINSISQGYASWTFREQPKFFDVVTYTGTGANRTIAHNLGSAPGCMFVKRTDTTGAWQVYHRNVGTTKYLVLNTTAAEASSTTRWNSTAPTDAVFSLGTATEVNASGGTYVAYLFAHDAGGFGLTGTSNVISCGDYTGNGSISGPIVTLGWEPQFVLIKNKNSITSWFITDDMRGFTANSSGGATVQLFPNSTAVEANFFYAQPSATGFQITDTSSIVNGSGENYIYIAIRRGPMKVPTVGTNVFTPVAANEARNGNTLAGSITPDLLINRLRAVDGDPVRWSARLSGGTLRSNVTDTELANTSDGAIMTTAQTSITWAAISATVRTDINYFLKRAPSFMDVVCYTGTGANTNFTHNLGAVPELMIVKRRDVAANWDTYSASLAATQYMVVNTTAAVATGATRWNSTRPTSSVFRVGTSTTTNASAGTYIAYLFATCAGVSKVGSYTGNATLTTINCGFTGGARFVMIKRTDSTGDWYIWDTARGMVAGTDPSALFNSTLAESNANSVYTIATGFQLLASPAVDVNTNGGTYIFLAIA